MIAILFSILGGPVRVELPAEALVRGAELELSAIAALEGGQGDAARRLGQVRLGWAPAPGHSRLLTSRRIALEIEAQAPGLAYELVGQPACRVRPEVETVLPEDILDAARRALERACAGRDVRLVPAQTPEALTLPVGERPRVLEARLASRDVHPGLVSVPVHAIVDGVRWRTVWTSWTAAVWEERTVLARDAAAGEEISAGMLEVRRLEAGGPAALDASRLVGSSLRRDARSGESLGEGDVLRRRLIEPGAAILLEIRMGGVSARTPATAQEGGARGDRVRVRLREGERSMLATVVSRELVVVDLTSSR